MIEPALEFGVEIDPRAVRAVLEYTQGYPYFIQEYGRVLWDRAERSPIGPVEAIEAQAIVEARLDDDFFATRLERATDAEVTYLRALAELGGNRSAPALSPVRWAERSNASPRPGLG